LEAYHLDGLRWDATSYIRHVSGGDDPARELPDGWRMMQEINQEIKHQSPSAFSVAEDLQQNAQITSAVDDEGAGFDAQWDVEFAKSVRDPLIEVEDSARDLAMIQDTLEHRFDDNVFHRVIYTESHDEVANGKARLPEEIWPGNALSWASKKRSTLGAAIVLTAPGIPMLFQGQEFMEDRWFDDQDPLDWSQAEKLSGIVQLYKDLIALRRNTDGTTRGLSGQNIEIIRLDKEANILAYHRWADGGPGDSAVIILNLANRHVEDYILGFPREGLWMLRFDSHAADYDQEYVDQVSSDTEADDQEADGLPASGLIAVAPYSAVIFSQDE
jgi:1,4-alpha-glucan branching enzyme